MSDAFMPPYKAGEIPEFRFTPDGQAGFDHVLFKRLR